MYSMLMIIVRRNLVRIGENLTVFLCIQVYYYVICVLTVITSVSRCEYKKKRKRQ